MCSHYNQAVKNNNNNTSSSSMTFDQEQQQQQAAQLSMIPVCQAFQYSFCPHCGVDVSQFSHEASCPILRR
ncbi:hypothetical protein BDB00DRAFT_241889 [Zychaea mexicana]|uniref:uncharacterized protein n=1 Tax=Zychaea mexicana TaxID=64656 RepID=UPI0022FE65DF|nr:uncharacterized protein BDB00DRAFT_241889 [Zychaea mexicana]KAI9495303.1 hypothetical protein BDB00DRAFT_241889 [Zychaea mexicana]